MINKNLSRMSEKKNCFFNGFYLVFLSLNVITTTDGRESLHKSNNFWILKLAIHCITHNKCKNQSHLTYI